MIGCVFCSRMTVVGLPRANASVKSTVARPEAPQAIASIASHCLAFSLPKKLRATKSTGIEKSSRKRCSASTIDVDDIPSSISGRRITPSVPQNDAPMATRITPNPE
jgi:hypothetical protein